MPTAKQHWWRGDNALRRWQCGKCNGNGATALGSGATVVAANATAVGVDALATAEQSVAIGGGASAPADSAVALGAQSSSSGAASGIAIGAVAVAGHQGDRCRWHMASAGLAAPQWATARSPMAAKRPQSATARRPAAGAPRRWCRCQRRFSAHARGGYCAGADVSTAVGQGTIAQIAGAGFGVQAAGEYGTALGNNAATG